MKDLLNACPWLKISMALLLCGTYSQAQEHAVATRTSWIECEGTYGGHLQGIATDGTHLYWSHTVQLVKTDLSGSILKRIDVPRHHGDLTCHDGKVYVAVELGQFNQAPGQSLPWVYVYDAASLVFLTRHPVPELVHGCGGIAYHDGTFVLVGGLPGDHQQNYLFEFDTHFAFRKRHVLPTGQTRLGIQTACYTNDHWWFGCYGSPKNPGLLKVDPHFQLLGTSDEDFSYGKVRLNDRTLLQGVCFEGKQRGKARIWSDPPATKIPEESSVPLSAAPEKKHLETPINIFR